MSGDGGMGSLLVVSGPRNEGSRTPIRRLHEGGEFSCWAHSAESSAMDPPLVCVCPLPKVGPECSLVGRSYEVTTRCRYNIAGSDLGRSSRALSRFDATQFCFTRATREKRERAAQVVGPSFLVRSK